MNKHYKGFLAGDQPSFAKGEKALLD